MSELRVEVVRIGDRRVDSGRLIRPIMTVEEDGFSCDTCGKDLKPGDRYILELDDFRHCETCISFIVLQEKDDE
jgi:hypothetical protein